jgi:hypothetical protein
MSLHYHRFPGESVNDPAVRRRADIADHIHCRDRALAYIERLEQAAEFVPIADFELPEIARQREAAAYHQRKLEELDG